MKIAIIGASGYVGSALTNHLKENDSFQIIPVVRSNYNLCQAESYDIVIHSAMPSKRWWALNNPYDDFQQTVGSTANLLYNWKYSKLILISSVSARIQLDHPYGVHKALAEHLVLNRSDNNLIVRLGGLYGNGLGKGVIFDMIYGNKVFMTSNSAFNYLDTNKAAELIEKRLSHHGLEEIGARDTITIGEIAKSFDLDVKFGDRYEYQNTESSSPDLPSAYDVLSFVRQTIDEKEE